MDKVIQLSTSSAGVVVLTQDGKVLKQIWANGKDEWKDITPILPNKYKRRFWPE